MGDGYSGVTAAAEDYRFLSDLSMELFQKSPDAIVIVNGKDGTIRLVNDQAEFLTGYHRSELRGRPVETLIPPASHDQHVRNRAEYMANPRVRQMYEHADLRLRGKTGNEVRVEIMLAPVATVHGVFVIATIRRKSGT